MSPYGFKPFGGVVKARTAMALPLQVVGDIGRIRGLSGC